MMPQTEPASGGVARGGSHAWQRREPAGQIALKRGSGRRRVIAFRQEHVGHEDVFACESQVHRGEVAERQHEEQRGREQDDRHRDLNRDEHLACGDAAASAGAARAPSQVDPAEARIAGPSAQASVASPTITVLNATIRQSRPTSSTIDRHRAPSAAMMARMDAGQRDPGDGAGEPDQRAFHNQLAHDAVSGGAEREAHRQLGLARVARTSDRLARLAHAVSRTSAAMAKSSQRESSHCVRSGEMPLAAGRTENEARNSAACSPL